MYCRNCGRTVEDNSLYCNNCGARLDNTPSTYIFEDNPSFGFALLGFFIPIVGLILFLVYEGKKPKRAKSAGKGALIGFIIKIAIVVFLVMMYASFSISAFGEILEKYDNDRHIYDDLASAAVSSLGDIADDAESNIPEISDAYEEETTDEILEEYVDVSFGEFKVSNNGYYPETSLDITVKNKAEKRYTYYITIEAVDANGARIDTEMLYADRLGAGQEIYLIAFQFVEEDKIAQFQNATFRVLDVHKFDF